MTADSGAQEALRTWMASSSGTSLLGLRQGTVRSPRPGAVTGQTTAGGLVTFEVRVYQAGQW
jgi:hypothetical protein